MSNIPNLAELVSIQEMSFAEIASVAGGATQPRFAPLQGVSTGGKYKPPRSRF